MKPVMQRRMLEELQELCSLSPSIRFGQLLANLDFLAMDQCGQSLWDIDDETLLDVIAKQRSDLTQKTSTVV